MNNTDTTFDYNDLVQLYRDLAPYRLPINSSTSQPPNIWDQVLQLQESLNPSMRQAVQNGLAQFVYDEEKQRVICLYKSSIPVMGRDITNPLQARTSGQLQVSNWPAVSVLTQAPTSWSHHHLASLVTAEEQEQVSSFWRNAVSVPGVVIMSRDTEQTELQAHIIDYIENNYLSYINCPNCEYCLAQIPNYLRIPMSRKSGKTTLIKMFQETNPDLKVGVFVDTHNQIKEYEDLGISNVYYKIGFTNSTEVPKMDIYFWDDVPELPPTWRREAVCDYAVKLWTPRYNNFSNFSF